MNGDISRFLFDPSKHYSSVREQQGRAQVDADRNENTDILIHDTRTARVDIIGQSGGPQDDALGVTAAGGTLQITPGRYYVDGIRCELRTENDAAVAYADQPNAPVPELPTTDGLYLVYIDVWERPITAVQDPSTREVALGGADTTTRNQVVWQVKTLAVTTNDPAPHCETPYPEWDTLVGGPTGTLEIRVADAGPGADPCVVPEVAGFRGLENSLYRLQVHDPNFDVATPGGQTAEDATFKWSRDNGSVVATWREHPSALEVTVERLGPGGANGLSNGDWIELTNDEDDLLGNHGVLAEIASISGATLVLADPGGTVAADLSPPPMSDAAVHSMLRKWDSSPGARLTTATVGEADVTNDGWIRIEDGIEARFSGGSFRSGDFWLLPARTAALPGTLDRQIEWPEVGGVPVALLPMGPAHHYAKLGLAEVVGGVWTLLEDCRDLFPPLTQMLQLDMLGGDGQHARSGQWLPASIRVGTTRGTTPVAGERVRFSLIPFEGNQRGVLSPDQPDEDGNVATSGAEIDVDTDANGVAHVWWRLGDGPTTVEEPGDIFDPEIAQQVEARLLGHDGSATPLEVRFTAQAADNQILVPVGGDAQLGLPGETLELALRVRVTDGMRPVPGARVRFSNLNRMLDGVALNEFTGGAIHASANVESFEAWPGGSRMMEATVTTDADGIAQAQFILGTEEGLPVQRVEAFLLDGDDRTAQWTLFSAHLAIASEIGWRPCRLLTPLINGEDDHNVQSALDALCTKNGQQDAGLAFLLQVIAALWEIVNEGGGVDPTGPGDLAARPVAELDLPNFINPVVVNAFLDNPERFFPGVPGLSNVRASDLIDSRRRNRTLPVEEGRELRISRASLPAGGFVPSIASITVRGGNEEVLATPDEDISLGAFESLRLTPTFAVGEVTERRARAGVSIFVRVPMAERGQPSAGHTDVALDGSVAVSTTETGPRLDWTPTSTALQWIAQQVRRSQEAIQIEVRVDPRALNPGASAGPHSQSFWVAAGR